MKTWCTGLLLVALAAGVAAQDFTKVGYINQQRILAESAPGKSATAKLEAEFSKRQKELADQQAALKAFGDKFERDAPTLTESQRAARTREFNESNVQFTRKNREFQEDLNSRRNEELQQVLDKANKAMRQVAESEKYDLILSEGIVYSNGKQDITDKVLKVLNVAK